MLQRTLALLFSSSLILTACQSLPVRESQAEQQSDSQKLYLRAEQFLPQNLAPLVKNDKLTANWLDGGSRFWFVQQHGHGHRFLLVDPNKNTQSAAFDHQKIADVLRAEGLTEVSAARLPFEQITLSGSRLGFNIEQTQWSCTMPAYTCDHRTRVQTEESEQGASPDGRWQVVVENHNLILANKHSGERTVLTQDGTEKRPYAATHPNPARSFKAGTDYQREGASLTWSKDSRYLITYQLDRSGTDLYTLVQSDHEASLRPKTVRYYYPSAGQETLPQASLVLVDTDKKNAIKLDAPPVMQTYYGSALWGWWQDNGRYVYHDRRRGNRQYFMREVDPHTAQVRALVEERDDKYIDPWVQTYWALPELDAFIWSSQRSGYQHLYLYQASSGELLNPITQGEMTIRVIRGMDTERKQLYFEASGRESGRDPYFRHLYRVNLDGSDLTLLTPEPAEHDTRLSPDFNYVIDTYSTASQAPVTVLRDSRTGKVVREIQRADISALQATGWRPPQSFEVLAADGKTSLYGLMYLPSNFDPNKRYPVIDDIYTGPHNFFTPKSFNTYSRQANALAELGFVVIKMDGRGTNKRGRVFHEYSFKNLGGGADDHVAAIRQLAQRHAFIDSDRVGIFGFSAGGYDTAHALFKYPDFFKVGVAASGNHDFRVDKAGWNEIWMGYPVTPEWDEQSNLTWAKHLQGKLLLAHGELDTNVHPAATMQLVSALIKADKQFDLMIYPNMGHVLDEHPHFVRLRWDYFLRHLKGGEPIKHR
ncbi:prolyl oligopeptidase family serine peptidase [Pseudoalteromonas rubra]|uniref:Prolyl oligopeptidase family serine peptidase n=1 Tax=Pseudoalteromonas rubra TaxID=43658 RepID=A0A5S3UVX6_9GAMM|nr:DPP IV N-terminal domain-containing protein [Pseudoalteromonas rubra]QPB85788.1 prolyl oligopeptidase family serine peptidase [Pseudoalteromonas rubra]